MTNLLVTVAFLVSGAFAGRARMGGLLALTGVTWALGDLVPEAALLHRGPLVHLLLSYPDGRLDRRHERAVVACAYLTGAWIDVGSTPAVTLATAVAVSACALGRWRAANGLARRMRAVPAVAAGMAGAVLAASATTRLLDAGTGAPILRAYEVVLFATAVALALDARSWRSAAVTGLVIDLGASGDGTLSARLARVLGDPTLVVRYPARDGYVDEHGRAVTGVGAGADRLVTPIRRGEREIAAVVHDRALPAGPELLEDAAGALSVALANAQMQAEVRDRVAAVEASRRRLVTAAEAERRRFGHRLRQATEAHLDAAERELAGDALSDLRKVRADIRLIAEGLDPLELAAGGLDRALSDLATRSTIPVAVDVRAGRLPPRIESGAWFVCSEALANVAKHSGASRAFIRVAKRDGLVRVEISDDGRGGADSARGSGLHGLADRVEALGGRLSVTERSRGGTSVVAELPVS